MIFSMLKAARCHAQEIAYDRDVVLGDKLQTLTSYKPDLGVDDRLGGKPVDQCVFQTEHIARQVESANLPPPVREQLVASYRSNRHLIDILGGLIFSEDFGSLAIAVFADVDPGPECGKLRQGLLSQRYGQAWAISLFLRCYELQRDAAILCNTSPSSQVAKNIYGKRRCVHYCPKSHCP